MKFKVGDLVKLIGGGRSNKIFVVAEIFQATNSYDENKWRYYLNDINGYRDEQLGTPVSHREVDLKLASSIESAKYRINGKIINPPLSGTDEIMAAIEIMEKEGLLIHEV